MLCNVWSKFAQRVCEFFNAGHSGMRFCKFLQEPTKCVLAVSSAYRVKMRMQSGAKFFQIAVVCKNPVASPQFAHERVAVLQAHRALRGLADMGNHIKALDGIAPDQLGNRRVRRGLMVNEVAQTAVFKESDAPSIGVIGGVAAPLGP